MTAESCVQYVDDNSIAAQNAEELLGNIEVVFQIIEFVGLELSMTEKATLGKKPTFKCHSQQARRSPLAEKHDKFSSNRKLPMSVTSLQRYSEIVNF